MLLISKNMIRLLLLLFLGLLLCSCGFKLRGQLSGDLKGTNVYLNADDIYSPLSVDLKRQLNLMKVHLVTTPSDVIEPVISIYLKNTREKRTTLSVDKTGRPVEYELILEVEVDIHDLNHEPPDELHKKVQPRWTTMHVRRVQVYDNNLLLAKSREREEVSAEMRHALVSQLIERIRVYAAQL